MSDLRRPLVAVALIAALAVPRAAAAEPMTLADAFALALANQPNLAGARARIAAATVDVDLVDLEVRPTVSASASYDVGARGGVALTEPAQGLAASVTGAWRIWDFGQRAARRAAAVAGVDVERVALTQVERALLQQVEVAYAQVLGTRAQAEVQRATLEAEARHLTEAEQYLGAGARTEIDVAQARARLATARVAQLRADNAAALAAAGLARAIGAPLPPAATFPTTWPAALAGEDVDLDALVREAARTDPDLAGVAAQRTATARARAATAVSTRPTLSATASVGVDALGTYGLPPDDRRVAGRWGVGVALSWQLYDGGARAARLRAADANLRGLDARRAGRLVELRYQVDAARLDLGAAKGQRLATVDSVAAASDQLRLAEARFVAGLGTSAELADAQDAVTRARGDAVAAEYQLALARATLRHLLGRIETNPAPSESNDR
ncbi:MAG: TolC family protein [Myxococcales bacterium]|nr:TolC family protein [Myxococcales bacterium]